MITLENYKEELGDLENIDWTYISEYQILSEKFIREFKDKVNWINISRYQTLSEDFIKEFKDRVGWYFISSFQTLSEEFIREFKDKVNWVNISQYQTLSEKFIKEFEKKHSSLKSYNILKVVHNCGKNNRPIIIYKNNPDIIHIGCFKGSKEKAIEEISKKYIGEEKDIYISKVFECFDYEKKYQNQN